MFRRDIFYTGSLRVIFAQDIISSDYFIVFFAMSNSVFFFSKKYWPLFSRWLTLGARVLRLYISTASPSDSLCRLVQFLVVHYIPVWFMVKQHSNCAEGAKNLYRSVQLLRELPEEIQKVVRPVLQRNAYWAHPEQLLLGMIANEHAELRLEAVRHIRAARQRETEDVRPFRLPTLKFGASSSVTSSAGVPRL